MPDGTSRFSIDGKVVFHFMGCSTFSGERITSFESLLYCIRVHMFGTVRANCMSVLLFSSALLPQTYVVIMEIEIGIKAGIEIGEEIGINI